MNRRTVLASVGIALFAGCVTDSTSGPGASTTPEETTTPTTTRDLTGTITELPELRVPSENDCPGFGDIDRVICYENAGDGAPLLLEPERERATLPEATLPFTLENDTDAAFSANFYAWSLRKLVDGEWFRIEPRIVPEPLMTLEPGGSHSWSLTVDNTDLGGPLGRAEGTGGIAVPGLGGGTYAFGITGWFDVEGEDYDDTGVALAARFELDGDELELAPTDDLEEVGREDGEKRVCSAEANRTYLARRHDAGDADDADDVDPRRMVTEQVVRETPLRNLLASFEEGIDRVRLDGRGTSALFFDGPGRIEYGGETYRVEEVED